MRQRSRSARRDEEDQNRRLLLWLWLTTVLSLMGTALVVAAALPCARVPVYDDAFFAQFCLLKAAFFAPQSAKNFAYLVACLAAPFVLAGSAFLARFLVEKIPSPKLPVAFRCGNIVNGLFLLWCLWPIVYCPLPAMMEQWPDWLAYRWFFAGEPFFTFSRLGCLGLAIGLGWFFYGRPCSYRNRNLAFGAVLGSWLLVVGTRFYVPVEVSDLWRFTHHLNPLVFALSQVVDGHHYLVDFPHRYGGYIEFLAPILVWFPRRLETILVLFGWLNVIAMAGLLVSLRLLIRSPLQLLLAGWSLLGVLVIDLGDNYYQNAVVRELLPALFLVPAIRYLRRPRWLLYGIISVLTALAPLWNQESGLVLWGSWTATLIARDMSEKSFRRIGWHVAAQTLLLAGAAAAFVAYLRLLSGRWPDPALFFMFEHLFAGQGYFCLPMLVPDAWMLVVAIYALGLATVAIFYLRGISSWRTHALLLISLMGVGFFSYFMGRSAESNLVSAAFVAPLLLGLVLSETRGLIALGRLSRYGWILLWPLTFLQVWWALLFVQALPNLTERSAEKLASSRFDLSTTPFGESMAFVQLHATPKENLYILSDQAGFYYYLSDTVSDLDLPSTDEFVWTTDIDRLVSAIESKRIPKLFVDQHFFEKRIYRDDIYDRIGQAIAQSCRVAAASPGGRITLYVPR